MVVPAKYRHSLCSHAVVTCVRFSNELLHVTMQTRLYHLLRHYSVSHQLRGYIEVLSTVPVLSFRGHLTPTPFS